MSDNTALDWLLSSDEPSIRYRALVDLLGESSDSPRARRARNAIRRSDRAQALLSGQQEDGGFGCHPYSKWRGSHWRLLRLADLDYPRRDRAVRRALDDAFPWLLGHEAPVLEGRARRCGSQEGAAVLYSVRLGFGDDPRVRELADRLISWQWPDGGWNCDRRPEADHSSFHESHLPLWGLAEYWRMTGDPAVRAAIDYAAELFLCHGLFRRDHSPTRDPIHPSFTLLAYPTYWFYNTLDCCRALAAAGRLSDPRASEALDLIAFKRRPDGTWAPEVRRWKPPGTKQKSGVEVVAWCRMGEPDPFLTLNALRVLKAAGRL